MTTKNKIDEEGITREGEILDEEDTSESTVEEDADDTQPLKGEDKDESPKDDEDAIPFHKHPRWIQKQQEIEDLKQQIADLEVATKASEKETPSDTPVDMPQEFIDLFGNSPEIWEKWQKLNARQRQDLEKEIIEKIKNEDKQQADAIEKGKQYVENSLATLEKAGKQFDRNELIKFMIDFEKEYAPILNAEGNYDFDKGLSLMQQMKADKKPADIDAKKKIADITSGKKSGDGDGKKAVVTTRDIRNKSFNTLALED